MKKCATCEKINKSLLLILLAVVILYLINYSIFGFNYNDIFSELNINKFIFDDNSKRHRLMEGTFNYLGTIIMGTIFFLFQKFIIRKQKVKKVERSFLDKSLIHYNIESLSKQNIFYLLLMVIIWVINNYLTIRNKSVIYIKRFRFLVFGTNFFIVNARFLFWSNNI